MRRWLVSKKDAITSILGVVGGFSIVTTFTLHFFEINGVETVKASLLFVFGLCFALNGWYSGKKITDYRKYIKK